MTTQNEAAERLYSLFHAIRHDVKSYMGEAEMNATLDTALAHERSAEVERLKTDEHWHHGPGPSCSICQFALAHEHNTKTTNNQAVIERLNNHPNKRIWMAAQDLGNALGLWDDPLDPPNSTGAVPPDVESVARSLRKRYRLKQSIPELMMGLDIALNALPPTDGEDR